MVVKPGPRRRLLAHVWRGAWAIGDCDVPSRPTQDGEAVNPDWGPHPIAPLAGSRAYWHALNCTRLATSSATRHPWDRLGSGMTKAPPQRFRWSRGLRVGAA